MGCRMAAEYKQLLGSPLLKGRGLFGESGEMKMSDRVGGNGQEQERRALTIIKGQELELHASGDVLDQKEFMNEAYHQALAALEEIVRHTRRFRDRQKDGNWDRDDLETELFQYSGNMIAFAGQRGAGKTQTMLTFSRFLAHLEDRDLDSQDLLELHGCRFFVMPPISPSALEESGRFLHVVLSRLYRYVERALERDDACLREDPSLRTELWRCFNRCVSGINGLSAGNANASDISELQDTVDGLALRESFYNLVSLALDRVLGKCKEREQAFLVLQLDDADSQVEKGYQVLEDVRRYLLVPNLVILMSSDVEMLHNVVLQNHMKQFPDLLKAGAVSDGVLSRTCRKYIDKLVPPSHMVHLPQLEQFTDLGVEDIELQYVKDAKGKNEPALDWDGAMPSRKLQDMVLAIIYKKTGIVFVSQDPWLNYIVPRSLRGLNQLLYMLSEMEDLPAFNPEIWDSPLDVARAVMAQYRTAARNLERFGNYFFYDWIDVKIQHQDDRLFLRELVNVPRASFVSAVQGYLRKRYAKTERMETVNGGTWTLYDLDRAVFLWKWNRALSTAEDMLFFAIGTIRTIRGHMAVWNIKRGTAEKWLSPGWHGEDRLFACDYDPERWQITARYPLWGFGNDPHQESLKMGETYTDKPIYLATTGKAAKAVAEDWNEKFPRDKESMEEIRELCSRVFLVSNGKPGEPGYICLLHFITLFLQMGRVVTDRMPRKISRDISLRQQFVYWVQENALRIALNWDVTERVCQEISSGILKNDFKFTGNIFTENLKILFERVDKALDGLNGGTLYALWKRDSTEAYSFGVLIYSLFSGIFQRPGRRTLWRLEKFSAYMQRERQVFHKKPATQKDYRDEISDPPRPSGMINSGSEPTASASGPDAPDSEG